jgi:hypothetical protein
MTPEELRLEVIRQYSSQLESGAIEKSTHL